MLKELRARLAALKDDPAADAAEIAEVEACIAALAAQAPPAGDPAAQPPATPPGVAVEASAVDCAGEIWAMSAPLAARYLASIDPALIAATEVAEANGVRAFSGGTQVASATSAGVLIMPMRGIMTPRVHPILARYGLGGASVEAARTRLRAAANDPNIAGVVMAWDTPGGSVLAVPDLAADMRAFREVKPLISVIDHMAASAGYWAAANSTEILISRAGIAGHIGALHIHTDMTASLEREGIKKTVFASSLGKAEGRPDVPLTEEARAYIQKQTDDMAAMFRADVAAGRRVSVAHVRAEFGNGRWMYADAALKAGLVDRIGTVEEAVAAIASGRKSTGRRVGASASAIPRRRRLALGV